MLRRATCVLALSGGLLATVPAAESNTKRDKEPVCGAAVAHASETPLDMIVPVKDLEIHLGDATIQINAGKVLVHGNQLKTALQSALRPEAMAKLPIAELTLISISVLCQAGLKMSFDSNAVELKIFPAVEQRLRGFVDGGGTSTVAKSEERHKPSGVSGYVNHAISVDFDHLAASDSLTGRADFDAALRLGDWVIEGELGVSAAGPGYMSKRLVYDDTASAVRYTFGDVHPVLAGHQTSHDLVGVSIARAFSKLTPDKNIRATGKRTFRLEQPSSVIVYINTMLARRLRLGPGEYDLDNLPLRTGVNLVTLEIEADTGEKSRLDFTVFFNRALLAPGVDEFGFNAGWSRQLSADGFFAVDGPLVASGFYRTGVTETLTLEAQAQVEAEHVMAGGGLTVQTGLGFISLDLTAALFDDHAAGLVFDTAYDSIPVRPWEEGPELNFRVAAGLETKVSKHDEAAAEPALTLSAAVIQRWSSDLTSMIAASTALRQDGQTDSWSVEFIGTRMIGDDLTASLSAGVEDARRAADGARSASWFGSVRLAYRLGADSQLGYSLDPRDMRSAATFEQQVGYGVGAWSLSAEVERKAKTADDPQHGLQGTVNYTGNRAEISLSHDRDFFRLGSEMLSEKTSLRVGSAVAFSEKGLAVGRPISGGFAIIEGHESLEGRTVSIKAGPDSVQATSDWLGPALVSNLSPYSEARLVYDVEELPAGYDLGAGVFEIFPPYRAGYNLVVGSSATVMAQGVLVNHEQQPLALVTGRLKPQGNSVVAPIAIFTTEDGAFFAQGLSPGVWILEVDGDAKQSAEFTIPESPSYVVDLKTIQVKP